MIRVFRDRHDAGAQLARALHRYAEAADAVVLAHTASSVPVAYEVATRLALPLDVIAHGEVGAHATLPFDQIVREGADENIFASRELTIDVADKIVLLIDDGDTARTMPLEIERLRA